MIDTDKRCECCGTTKNVVNKGMWTPAWYCAPYNTCAENKEMRKRMNGKKATEYAVLVWYEPEDQEAWDEDGCLGSPSIEHNIDTLEEALEIYKQETDVFAKELHHYYEVDLLEWESSSNVLMAWDVNDE